MSGVARCATVSDVSKRTPPAKRPGQQLAHTAVRRDGPTTRRSCRRCRRGGRSAGRDGGGPHGFRPDHRSGGGGSPRLDVPWCHRFARRGCGRGRPQHAGHRGDRRPLRGVLRAHLGDHAHRTLTKLVGILARMSHDSNPPNIASLRDFQGVSVAGLKTSREAAVKKLTNLDRAAATTARSPAGTAELGIPIPRNHQRR